MSDLLGLLEGCGLHEYKPRHYYSRGGLISGRTKKKPRVIARKWIGPLLVELQKFEGRNSIVVSDESRGYSKKLATATGLDELEGEDIFEEVCGRLIGYQ